MIWTPYDLDLIGTIHDLHLDPLPARLLARAALHITEDGTRSFAVSTLLAHHPHRIRSDPDRHESGYQLEGGRALRAAVMVRSLELMEGRVKPSTSERLLAAAMLGNLVHTGPISDVQVRRAWLHRVADENRDHLASRGLPRARASNLIDLAVIAAGIHADASGLWVPTGLPEPRMIMACKAAERARPLPPLIKTDPAPFPAWLDPDLPNSVAARLYREDRYMDHILRHLSRPELRFQRISRTLAPSP